MVGPRVVGRGASGTRGVPLFFLGCHEFPPTPVDDHACELDIIHNKSAGCPTNNTVVHAFLQLFRPH